VDKYHIKKVLAGDYKPGDGEPFAAGWGPEGWTIWCRTLVIPRQRKKQVKKKPLKGV
jgi:hypothetical protein